MSYFVSFRYSPEKLSQADPILDSPSKIVRLHYNAKNTTPRSLQRQRSRTPTPPDALPSKKPKASKSISKRSVISKREYLRDKSCRQSIQDMKNYSESFSTTSSIEAEQKWYYDLQNVATRLHYLREIYKAIQALKRKSARDRAQEPNLTVQDLASSNIGSPAALEDELTSNVLSSQIHDHDDDSGSNTDMMNDLGIDKQ